MPSSANRCGLSSSTCPTSSRGFSTGSHAARPSPSFAPSRPETSSPLPPRPPAPPPHPAASSRRAGDPRPRTGGTRLCTSLLDPDRFPLAPAFGHERVYLPCTDRKRTVPAHPGRAVRSHARQPPPHASRGNGSPAVSENRRAPRGSCAEGKPEKGRMCRTTEDGRPPRPNQPARRTDAAHATDAGASPSHGSRDPLAKPGTSGWSAPEGAESSRTRSPSRQLGRCTARDKPQSPRRAAAAKATEPCAGSGPSPGRASASRRAAASCFGAARGGGRRPLRGHRSCRPWPRPGAVAKAGLPPPGFAGVTTGRRTPVLSGSDPTLRPLPHPDPVPGAGRWRPAPRPRSGGRQPAVPVRRPGSAAGAAPARRSGWRPSNPSRAAARIRPREGGTPAQTAAACRRSCRSAGGLRKPLPSHRLALQCAHGAAAQAVRERWAGAGGRSAAGVQVPK